ncbi:MAG: hypothetical protein KGH66_04230, partial [Candidatus Micrarchaeota archaeon]|nr:hypothetical protein [Candidatus Micrarchaeota archaeon]
GIVGDVITDIAYQGASKLGFQVFNNYHIPESVRKDTMVIGISCSGNTAETLMFVSEAEARGIGGYAIASGGKMEEFAKGSKNFGFIKSLMLKVQRASFPGLIFPLLKFMSENGILEISGGGMEEAISCMEKVRDECKVLDPSRNRALSIALKIVDHDKFFIPIIYGSRRTRAAGRRFRQSLNENSKVHAFSGEIPEVCHNSIVGWDSEYSVTQHEIIPGHKIRSIPVLLRFDDDPGEIKARFDVMAQLLAEGGAEVIDAPYTGKDHLCKTMTMIYYLEYVTYYVAILRGVNPIVTPSIDKLKSRLAAMDKGY